MGLLLVLILDAKTSWLTISKEIVSIIIHFINDSSNEALSNSHQYEFLLKYKLGIKYQNKWVKQMML